MAVLRKAFDFFIFSSLYISLCAVIMLYQSTRLLLHSSPPLNLSAFVFFATVCSYNFHWYLTPYSATSSQRMQWTLQHKTLHLVLYFVGVIGSIVSFFSLREHWMALAFGAFVTFLYSAPKLPQDFFKALKNIAIGKTFFLAFVWMYVTTMLPIFVSNVPWRPEFTLFALNRFLLIYAICILFDYRDREDDKRAGIRSMITLLNEKGIDRLFTLSIVLFVISSIALYAYNYTLYTIIILLTPGIITAAISKYSKKHFSDYLYYFVLDGLMMLSALMVLAFRLS